MTHHHANESLHIAADEVASLKKQDATTDAELERDKATEIALRIRIETYIELEKRIAGEVVASNAFTASMTFLKKTVPLLKSAEAKWSVLGEADTPEG